jgi:hypothetical protein
VLLAQVAGGANQAAGVQVTYPAPLFNGYVRIKPKYFGPPRGRTQPYIDDPSISPNGIILQQAAGAKLYVIFWEVQADPDKNLSTDRATPAASAVNQESSWSHALAPAGDQCVSTSYTAP